MSLSDGNTVEEEIVPLAGVEKVVSSTLGPLSLPHMWRGFDYVGSRKNFPGAEEAHILLLREVLPVGPGPKFLFLPFSWFISTFQ